VLRGANGWVRQQRNDGPLWVSAGSRHRFGRQTDEKGMRAIGLALLDSDLSEGAEIEIDIRGKLARA